MKSISAHSAKLNKRIERFANEWREASHIRPLHARLVPLFIQLGPLLEKKRIQFNKKPQKGSPIYNLSNLKSTLLSMRDLLKAKRERLYHNPWTMSGLGRYEVRNCAVLSQLWDPRVSGPLATQFLGAYFAELKCPRGTLPTLKELTAGYTVRSEHCPTGAQSERVDLTIEGTDFLVGIEVKIDAAEGPEQLKRYRKVIASRALGMKIPEDRQCVVFLAPYRTSVEGVLQSSWRNIGAAGRSITANLNEPRNTAAWLIQCFAEHSDTFSRKLNAYR